MFVYMCVFVRACICVSWCMFMLLCFLKFRETELFSTVGVGLVAQLMFCRRREKQTRNRQRRTYRHTHAACQLYVHILTVCSIGIQRRLALLLPPSTRLLPSPEV